MGDDEVSPNYANKVISNPLQNLKKGQKKISFYFFDTQRALKPNISCNNSPAQPPT